MEILIVEDDRRVADLVARGLREAGFTSRVAADGSTGVQMALEIAPALVLLDIRMPKKDGVTVLREIRRQRPDLPVIMLTVKDDLHTKVQCLEDGADDYLTKPFAFEELIARVRAQLRERASPTASVLQVGGLTLDLHSHEAIGDGSPIRLSGTEFRLLELFMRHPGQVLNRAQILSHVWGYDFLPASNVVDVYVGYLRRKLSRIAAAPCIETVRGCGYRLVEDRHAAAC